MEKPPEKATLLQAFRTVFSAFLGVRKRDDHEKLRITPLQLVLTGLVAAALFVITVVTIVRLVTGRI